MYIQHNQCKQTPTNKNFKSKKQVVFFFRLYRPYKSKSHEETSDSSPTRKKAAMLKIKKKQPHHHPGPNLNTAPRNRNPSKIAYIFFKIHINCCNSFRSPPKKKKGKIVGIKKRYRNWKYLGTYCTPRFYYLHPLRNHPRLAPFHHSWWPRRQNWIHSCLGHPPVDPPRYDSHLLEETVNGPRAQWQWEDVVIDRFNICNNWLNPGC